ncbi:MAG: universal stress protein [Alphaproteobacteria bacterium]|nr:universal stress protein [Alphaproteobacteria bacterium]MCW5743059.1 universal stress protein [Alphaproteobacteria bacterium]
MSDKGSILVPVDGSANSDRAVKHAIALVVGGFADMLHLVNVQAPVGGVVSTFIDRGTISDYHREQGDAALRSARRLCEEAGVRAQVHIFVGRPGEIIGEYARKIAPRQVVLGTRGHSGISGVVMGSVAQDVLAHVDVPVTLVK